MEKHRIGRNKNNIDTWFSIYHCKDNESNAQELLKKTNQTTVSVNLPFAMIKKKKTGTTTKPI